MPSCYYGFSFVTDKDTDKANSVGKPKRDRLKNKASRKARRKNR